MEINNFEKRKIIIIIKYVDINIINMLKYSVMKNITIKK